MVHTYLKLPVHGHLDHFVFISIASYICWERGFTFLDPEGFAFKWKCPGIPDIYIRRKRKMKDQYGTRTYDQYTVIEIETHSNAEDTAKKMSQFESAAQNVELVIVPLNKFDKWREREKKNGRDLGSDLSWYREFISLYIPESEVSK